MDALGVDQGGWMAIVGPSGSGKTTLLKIMAGLVESKGEIKVAGVMLNHLLPPALRQFRLMRLGQVFQDFELLDYLTVEENILLPARLHPVDESRESIEERVRSLAVSAGLEKCLSRTPETLSRGEQQRAAICRALLLSPKIILADEPTASLDPASKEGVMDLLLECCRKENTTVVTVTHDMEVAHHHDKVIDVSEYGHPIPRKEDQ